MVLKEEIEEELDWIFKQRHYDDDKAALQRDLFEAPVTPLQLNANRAKRKHTHSVWQTIAFDLMVKLALRKKKNRTWKVITHIAGNVTIIFIAA